MSRLKSFVNVSVLACVVSACGSAAPANPVNPVNNTGVGTGAVTSLNGNWTLASYSQNYGAEVSVGTTTSPTVETAFKLFFGYNQSVSNALPSLGGVGGNYGASFGIQFSSTTASLIISTSGCTVSIPMNVNAVNAQGFTSSPISFGGQTVSQISIAFNGKQIAASGTQCGSFANGATGIVQGAGSAIGVGYMISGASQLTLVQNYPQQMVLKFQKQ